ncbi:unnamed protein product [Peniophora sp. CBMAI 1063]|nr:unnamed protein product [Peniophora sp. CBMAI 1063]
MNTLLTFLVSTAAVAMPIMAQTLSAGSTVQFGSNENPDLCLGAVYTYEYAQILLQPCGAPGTTFTLDNGISSIATRLEVVYSGDEPLCVNAVDSQAGNTPVLLEVCADDLFERWYVEGGTGTGQIRSAVETEDFCLTAAVDGQGDPVEYQVCTGTPNQQWSTYVIDEA